MHDHRLDGMLQFDHKGVTARALRLHLDNSHDAQTRGWDYAAQNQLHHKLHADEAERLAGIEDAANLLADKLAAAPPAVVEAVVGDESPRVDKSIYLSDANGTLFLAEPAGAWDGPLTPAACRCTAEVCFDEGCEYCHALGRQWPCPMAAGPLYRLTECTPEVRNA